jgi:hypothetical protein
MAKVLKAEVEAYTYYHVTYTKETWEQRARRVTGEHTV